MLALSFFLVMCIAFKIILMTVSPRFLINIFQQKFSTNLRGFAYYATIALRQYAIMNALWQISMLAGSLLSDASEQQFGSWASDYWGHTIIA